MSLYWLVDPDDGIIVDARFQAYGQSALIGAAEIACELSVGKNYDQARRIGAELIDKQVRDRPDEPAFPKETSPSSQFGPGGNGQRCGVLHGYPPRSQLCRPAGPPRYR